MVMPATNFVLPDEKAYWFIETWQRVPFLGDRRVQRIVVRRSDELSVFQEDMGPWDWATDRPSQAPGLWQYTVAQLREITDIGRGRADPQQYEPIDIKTVYMEEMDERRMGHRSVFGRFFKKER